MNSKPFIPSNSPYPGSTGSTGRAASTQASATNGVAGTCQITASDGGAVTGTLTWSGGSANTPAPSAAIVMETSTATWGGTVGDSPPFTFSPDPTAGLGSGVTAVTAPSGQFMDPDGYGFYSSTTCTGIKYSAATSGSGSTTTCSPNFVLSGTTGINSDSYEYCALGYTYKVTAFPVNINLAGTTSDSTGKLNILVGQGCKASLVGIPFNLLPNTTYSWTVSDANNTFQSWDGSGTAAPVSVDAGPGRLDQPTAHWFWSDTAGFKTVTCTATVTPPSGQGVPFTLTVTQQVNLEVPAWVAKNVVGVGYIGTTPNSVLGVFAGPTLDMINQGYMNGSNWKAFVPVPPDFAGTGQWQYAQIVTPGEYETPYGGTEIQSTDTGMTGLDDVFPYGTPHDTGGSFITDVDSPNFQVFDIYGRVRLADSFNTYLMFKPPLAPSAPNSDDVQWVPLAESGWLTSFDALRPGTGHWSTYPQGQSVGSMTLIYDFMPQKTHPQWNTRINNTTVFP